MSGVAPGAVISTILKHDSKVTSYKIALLRAINDVVLAFPDIRNLGCDVAIPLRVLAEFWLAYYWPFVDPDQPILQGPRSFRDGVMRNDMAFRAALSDFRRIWQNTWGGLSSPADGYTVINELRIPRRRVQYSDEILNAYDAALRHIARAIQMPIRHAGLGEWTVFAKPQRFSRLKDVVGIPGTQPHDVCLLINETLWQTFRELSLWVEALCIHEWSLFTERVEQPAGTIVDRGITYKLLTAHPDNRRPLTWERNHIDVLLMEGYEFVCPWTARRITDRAPYDLDHIVPVSVYPINELWNLVPADPDFNAHTKRDRLPSPKRLFEARPHLLLAYTNYGLSAPLAQAIQEDVAVRFVRITGRDFVLEVTDAVMDFVASLADTRNLAQF
jgi:hypothetical protein